MKLYSVYLRDHGRKPLSDLILVKEGFSWPAFVFTFMWALWTRMWLPTVALFAVIVLSGWGMRYLGLGETAQSVLSLAVAIAVGLIGNDLRRWWLDRQGYYEVAVVTGNNAEEATRRFLDNADIARDGIYPGVVS